MNLLIVIRRVIQSSMCLRLTERASHSILLVLSLGESIDKHSTNYLNFCLNMTKVIQSVVTRCSSCGRESHGHYVKSTH